MAYGKLGRTGAYHVQDMLRMVGAGQEDVGLARALLSALPQTNWHQRNAIFQETSTEPDVEIADRYLNPLDRAFTVAELRHLAGGAGLKIAAFVPPLFYDPLPFIADPDLRGRVAKLSWIDRCTFAETYNGGIPMHNFYMVADDTVIRLDALLEAQKHHPDNGEHTGWPGGHGVEWCIRFNYAVWPVGQATNITRDRPVGGYRARD